MELHGTTDSWLAFEASGAWCEIERLAMPSAKERRANRRAKLKKDYELYQAYLRKEAQRKSAQRSASKARMSTHQLEEHRMKERLRLRDYRAKKSKPVTSQSLNTTPYRSSQAFGKAMKRARTSLPTSPRKRQCVVEKLARTVGIALNSSSASPSSHSGALSEDTKVLVNTFYNSSDISWQAPGRKDRVIFKKVDEEGKKVKRMEQTRYMLLSLREAYSKFVEDHAASEIGLSKFCELRPVNVKLFNHIPHQVCVCSYHENVLLLLLALQDHTSFRANFSAFIDEVTCDSCSKKCMSSQCSVCADRMERFAPSNTALTVRYRQWQNTDRVEKVDIMGTLQDVFDELKQQLEPFLLHTFIKRKQAKSFELLIEKCDGENILLQVDFSENATITSQREIQSAHWSYRQATLFTAHAWIERENVRVSWSSLMT